MINYIVRGMLVSEDSSTIRLYKCLPKCITSKPFKPFKLVASAALDNTVLDKKLSKQGGFIPLLPNISINICLRKTDTVIVHPGNGFYVPKGGAAPYELSTGVAVITPFQRAIDRLIGTMRTLLRVKKESGKISELTVNAYCDAVRNYYDILQSLVFGKNCAIDKAVGSIMPCSARAVLVNDPGMAPNEVGIPGYIIRAWLRNEKCRETYNIDPSMNWDDCKQAFRNTRVIIGRQPTHDRTNLFASVMRITSGCSIRMNPAVVNLFDGDFDGDTVHVHLPLTDVGIRDLSKLSVERLLPESTPGKEFSGMKLSSNALMAEMEFRVAAKQFHTQSFGKSINWKDLTVEEGSTGYFDDKAIDHDKLQEIANSTYKWMQQDTLKRQSNAMLSYRQLKIGTAKAGGLSNIFVNLCIALLYFDKELSEKIDVMHVVGIVKHTLCQNQLSHKHGSGQKDAVFSKIYDIVYNNRDYDYVSTNRKGVALSDALRKFGISNEHAEVMKDSIEQLTTMGIPSNYSSISDLLIHTNPWYVCTRKQGNIKILHDATTSRVGVQAYFLRGT